MGEIKKGKTQRDGNQMIICNNEEQERAFKMIAIGKCEIASTVEIGKRKGAKGVISRVPINVSVDEVKANLKAGILKDVLRLRTFRNGVKTDSESFLLEFESQILPSKVTIGYMCYKVREYIPWPMRCFDCRKF